MSRRSVSPGSPWKVESQACFMACDCDGPQSTLAISPRAQGGRTRIPALPAGACPETLMTLERVEWNREEYAVFPRRRMRSWFRRHDDMQMGDWAPACAAAWCA
ncbi:hypothetical protein SJA_C1-17840 [Sphingobium indicum UT26S]|uniref:Uncharacterized protein n=1 Tax=Sphingobium indicum (strain DSM 16413 / CCM 7287 / MTCC 6362 / UT26 / NBRC 101211 / UT26S) TaxID=452662 RepID=D4Z1Y6_SPHIU|nr:hypothetical protein SJA_C1-17840 [Sphingobium indicum UT26S]